MEDYPMVNNQEKVPVNATLIVSKYKSLKDRLNFCFEKNWYHPNEVGFDANFFLKVLMGEKKYLPNNFTVNYKLHFFRKGEKLDKNYIIEKMKGNQEYATYTPDIKDPKKFSKDFLLLLIAYIDPNLYRQLYSINKKQLEDRVYNKLGDYQLDISKNLVKDIEDFSSINTQNNFRGSFRRTKNSIPTETFYKFRNVDEQEIQNRKKIEIIKSNDAYLRQQLESLNDINKDNQLKNKKLEEENKNLILKMKEMEQMIINKNIINDKNEIKENKSGKRGSSAERNDIGVKIIPIKASSKK